MYVCVWVCMCARVYACIIVHADIHVYTCVNVCMCERACVCVCMRVHVYGGVPVIWARMLTPSTG